MIKTTIGWFRQFKKLATFFARTTTTANEQVVMS